MYVYTQKYTYIYMLTYTYVLINIRIHTCTQPIYMYIHDSVNTHTLECIFIASQRCLNRALLSKGPLCQELERPRTCTQLIYICIYTHTHTHTHTHIRMCTLIYICIHTCTQPPGVIQFLAGIVKVLQQLLGLL